MPFSKYNIGYDTKKSLENDIGARNFDNDKSAQHFTSFQIEAKCTIRQLVYFLFSKQFKLPKHHLKLPKNAQLSDPTLEHFPISSKLYFAHATPLVTYSQDG